MTSMESPTPDMQRCSSQTIRTPNQPNHHSKTHTKQGQKETYHGSQTGRGKLTMLCPCQVDTQTTQWWPNTSYCTKQNRSQSMADAQQCYGNGRLPTPIQPTPLPASSWYTIHHQTTSNPPGKQWTHTFWRQCIPWAPHWPFHTTWPFC